MLVEKKEDIFLLLYTSKTMFRSAKLSAMAVEEYLKSRGDDYNNGYMLENTPSNLRTHSELIGRWDLYPFFCQMREDLHDAQHYLYNVPIVWCNWIPQEGSYNFDRRIKEWEKRFGLDTEVVYETGIDDMPEIYNGLEAYGGEYNTCYEHDEWVSIYHIDNHSRCQDFGGISLWINQLNYDIKIFGIGEDDGFVFPEMQYYKDYKALNPHEKGKFCQILNDIHIDNFDTQAVIDKIWKFPLTNKTCYDK